MHIPDVALPVHDAVHRHSPQFEQVDLLSIQARHPMIGIRKTHKRYSFILPISFEHIHIARSHGQDLHPAGGELGVPELQARQRRAAVRSHEPAQEV